MTCRTVCEQRLRSEVLKLIAEITTTTVLSVKSRPVASNYRSGVMISDARRLRKHRVLLQ